MHGTRNTLKTFNESLKRFISLVNEASPIVSELEKFAVDVKIDVSTRGAHAIQAQRALTRQKELVISLQYQVNKLEEEKRVCHRTNKNLLKEIEDLKKEIVQLKSV